MAGVVKACVRPLLKRLSDVMGDKNVKDGEEVFLYSMNEVIVSTRRLAPDSQRGVCPPKLFSAQINHGYEPAGRPGMI